MVCRRGISCNQNTKALVRNPGTQSKQKETTRDWAADFAHAPRLALLRRHQALMMATAPIQMQVRSPSIKHIAYCRPCARRTRRPVEAAEGREATEAKPAGLILQMWQSNHVPFSVHPRAYLCASAARGPRGCPHRRRPPRLARARLLGLPGAPPPAPLDHTRYPVAD